MDLKKIDLDKLQDYAFTPYELAMVDMASNQKFINIKCLDNESLIPTVQAILLDRIKQAREEIDDLYRYYDNDLCSGNNDSMFKCNEVLEILDKLIESEEK